MCAGWFEGKTLPMLFLSFYDFLILHSEVPQVFIFPQSFTCYFYFYGCMSVLLFIETEMFCIWDVQSNPHSPGVRENVTHKIQDTENNSKQNQKVKWNPIWTYKDRPLLPYYDQGHACLLWPIWKWKNKYGWARKNMSATRQNVNL